MLYICIVIRGNAYYRNLSTRFINKFIKYWQQNEIPVKNSFYRFFRCEIDE